MTDSNAYTIIIIMLSFGILLGVIIRGIIIRGRIAAFYGNNLKTIYEADKSFKKNLSLKLGYFNNHKLSVWSDKYRNLHDSTLKHPHRKISLPKNDASVIDDFINYFANGDQIRLDFNKRFIIYELNKYSAFFDQIEGKSLDVQQKTAIITDEDNNLVVAGAGSGKTTTAVGKIKYIVDRYNVKPSELVALSFTDKSAKSLADRINTELQNSGSSDENLSIEVKTFHKFSLDIVSTVEGVKPSVFDTNNLKNTIKSLIVELLKNEEFKKAVSEFLLLYFSGSRSIFDFESEDQYKAELKFNPSKACVPCDISRKEYRIVIVKSLEESQIANFLFINGLDFAYEKPYEFNTATKNYSQYKPDFTIKQGNKTVYLEHFAVRRNGDVPDWFSGREKQSAKERYNDEIAWKRKTHKKRRTQLIETYSYEMFEGNLFVNLEKKLIDSGIIFSPLPPNQIWSIMRNSDNVKDKYRDLVDLIMTFINLLKSNNLTLDRIKNRNEKLNDKYEMKRNNSFLSLLVPVYEKYQDYLATSKEIDFSDMIIKATDYIQNSQYKRTFKYIIVDEFQDLSLGRYQLIKAIKDKNPGCKLFGVGDDWQSIFRFSGSDLTLFNEFGNYFGNSVVSKIETTYRYGDPLIRLSGEFIRQNPIQIEKKLKPNKVSKKTKYEVIFYDNGYMIEALRNYKIGRAHV